MSLKKFFFFFTGKRGGFSHFVPIIRELEKQKKINFKIIAGDMHLSSFFGKTIKEIKKYTNNIVRLKNFDINNSISNRVKNISKTTLEMSKIFKKIKPDFLFLLGDRGEVLGASIAALHHNIPIIHMYGGDVTQGGTDEPTRHAITKISNIHLVSNKKSYNNILKMGEEPWRVHNVGLSSLDLFNKKNFKTKEFLEKKYKIDLKKPVIILIQHSVTWQINQAKKQIQETLKALKLLKIQTIAVYPCSDPGYLEIVKELEKNKCSFLQCYKNIEITEFYSLVKYASLIVGNSSCGIMETNFFKKIAINIGIRQEGRFSGKNIINVKHDYKKIIGAIKKGLKLYNNKNINIFEKKIYGNGKSVKKIMEAINKNHINDKQKLIQKKFIEK
jgi:UDP-hydrolysing UDP-N-acetyl-D-glucosamine 2-epimerase|tara:strand:- start:7597 stop:8757 length:1161 start_codon:yes stop_codon:yes gene_type:complete